MKSTVSIITVVYNGSATIRDCLASVASQSYPVEHIIIDGGSTDDTLKIVSEFPHVARVVSERDNGIYDAMNKGIHLATGDIIGLLNADDVYVDDRVLEKIGDVFANPAVDGCYSDLVYVERIDTGKIVRYWKSCAYNDTLFKKGWMPPHPTFYVRKTVYDRLGLFDLNFKIASDSELMLRFIGKHRIATKYIPHVTVKMRLGGTTNKSIANIIKQNHEIYRAARKNEISLSLFYLVHKLQNRLLQFLRRPV